MEITIVYDNEAFQKGLKTDWGFSSLVEVGGRKILFDTGASGSTLLSNMKELGIDPVTIDEVFISHSHHDHTGGLSKFLALNEDVTIYCPPSFAPSKGKRVIIKEPQEIHESLYSTGELKGIEQSLCIKTSKGLVVITGCSHPGVGTILQAASQFGTPYMLIGGLHGFSQFKLLENLKVVCPMHCTQHKSEIRKLYPEKVVEGGAGKVFTV